MNKIQEAAQEARMASAQSLTKYATHTSLDDFKEFPYQVADLSYDEVAESAFEKGAEWVLKHSIDEIIKLREEIFHT